MSKAVESTPSIIARLQARLAELEHDLTPILAKSHAWFSKTDIFNGEVFHSRSNELEDYIKELRTNIHRLITVTDHEHASYLTAQISEQFACFKNFLNSQGLDTKYQAQRRQNQTLQQRVKNIARVATQTSQELYQELSKLQEYERRLLDMVNEKTQQLTVYQGAQKSEMQQHVLLTQQRLGRCRQAISGVEEKIQKLDAKQ